MKKELIIYGLAIGINRGAVLILMPFLVSVLSTADFGLFNYAQLLFQLAAPILSLNIIVSIAREGADDPKRGLFVYKKFFLPLLVVALLIATCFHLFVNIEDAYIYTFALVLAGFESWHNMQLNVFRAFEKNWKFFLFSVLKTIGLGLLFGALYLYDNQAPLEYYLALQCSWFFVLAVVFHTVIIKESEENASLSLLEAAKFSMVLIPHSLSLWLIASSGRFFIKEMYGAFELGVFSKFFNVAMILMVINSGLGVVLPQRIIRDYDKWSTYLYRRNFIVNYSLAGLAMFLFLTAGIVIDSLFIHIIDIDYSKYGFSFTLIFSGFFLLGFYYVYSNILFSLRKNKTLALVTLTTATFSIAINFIMVKNYALFGAAGSVAITYGVYWLCTFVMASKHEVSIKQSIWKEIGLVILFLSSLYPIYLCTLYALQFL
ncbi:MAG: O-antigen/teichoic acid export membrane protein [Glaciecola sp.]